MKKLDFKKTLDNSKRNITKADIARKTFRRWATIQNYYNESTKIPNSMNTALIEMFLANSDEVFYIQD